MRRRWQGGKRTGPDVSLGSGNSTPRLHRPGLKSKPLSAVDRLRLERGAEHVHRLGPRALAEFMGELAEAHSCAPAMLAKLDAWHRLTPELVAAAGGDRFAPPPLDLVPCDL